MGYIKDYSGSGKSEKLETCKRCGQEVAWTTSKKTGKRYMCEVMSTPSESFYRDRNVGYCPWKPHTRENCEAAQREAVSRNISWYQEEAIQADWEWELDRGGWTSDEFWVMEEELVFLIRSVNTGRRISIH